MRVIIFAYAPSPATGCFPACRSTCLQVMMSTLVIL